jgi:hypothetical protein
MAGSSLQYNKDVKRKFAQEKGDANWPKLVETKGK